jgi:hypothetical protein
MLEQDAMQRDDYQIRQMLVVVELRKSVAEFGHPESEGIAAVCERIAGGLHVKEMHRTVVSAGFREASSGSNVTALSLRGSGATARRWRRARSDEFLAVL